MTPINPYDPSQNTELHAAEQAIHKAQVVIDPTEFAGEELITIATYRYAIQAESAALALRRQGYYTFIADKETNTADWFIGNGVGWIKLQVPGKQAVAARQYLEDTPGLLWAEGYAQPSVADNTCLSCGAEMPETADHCQACGWTYDATQDKDDGEVM